MTDKIIETLARSWIDCDPNRQGSEPGSGYHPDDPIPPSGRASNSSGGEVGEAIITPLTGKPLWQWFIPRAEAQLAYLRKRGIEVSA